MTASNILLSRKDSKLVGNRERGRGLKMFSIHEKLNRNKSLQCDTYKSFSVIVISAKSCLVMDRRVPENRGLEVSRRNGFLKGKWRNFEKSSNIP